MKSCPKCNKSPNLVTLIAGRQHSSGLLGFRTSLPLPILGKCKIFLPLVVGSTVDKAIVSTIRRLGFESSHQHLLLNINLLSTICNKDEKYLKRRRELLFLFAMVLIGNHINCFILVFQKLVNSKPT